jgi:hypothetical protein
MGKGRNPGWPFWVLGMLMSPYAGPKTSTHQHDAGLGHQRQ